MKLYNKPELIVEAFDVEDVITDSTVNSDKTQGSIGFSTAGMEFDINADGNEF